MDFSHELIMPNDDIPFKMFVFEGRNGSYSVISTGTVLWRFLPCLREVLVFLSITESILSLPVSSCW